MDYSRNQRRNSQAIRMQQEHIDKGKLQIQITSQVTAFPIQNAQVSISYTGVPENTLEKLQTDSSGQTEEIELAAPPIEYSLNPESDQQPYSEYTLNVEAEGFEPVSISGAEILADVTAIQNVEMRPRADMQEPGGSVCDSCTHIVWRIPGENCGGRDQTSDRIRRNCAQPCGDSGVCRST